MGLNLRIENEPRLPDGGPLTYAITGNRGADIGRDSHLDWSLPDPSRHVSGKHCEIRCQDGSYWLYDVSRNGTFLNGSDRRVQSPHRLRSGDRLMIGHYIVAVEVTDDVAAQAPAPGPSASPDPEDPWGGAVGAAPPLDPRELRPAGKAIPIKPDFLEWAVDVPNAPGVGFVARPATPAAQAAARIEQQPEPLSWDAGSLAPPPPPPEPPPPVPTPRRSVWVSPGPSGPWGGEDDASSPPPVAAPIPAPPPTLDWSEPVVASPLPPAPMAPPEQAATSAPPQQSTAAPSDLINRFAKGAGIAAGALSGRDPGDFAESLGRLMLIVADNVKQLLEARAMTKRVARSSNQTMIAALDNNPLKFSPTAAEALRTMLNPSSGGYLDADRALRQSFDDLKAHQLKTFSAMQRALGMLLEDMDPKSLQKSLGEDKGLSSWFGLRRSRLWTLYESRWQSRIQKHGGGMQDLFMQYFTECYDMAPDPVDNRVPGRRV